MTAPSVASVGTVSVGVNNRTPGVPTGVVAGQFVLGLLGSGANNPSEVWTGFSLFMETAQALAPNDLVFSKVASESDSGTYTVSGLDAVQNAAAQAARIIDIDTASPFFASTSHAHSATATTGAVSLTGLPEDATLVWMVYCQNARSITTFPGSIVRKSGTGSQFLHWGTQEMPDGGDSGSITATLSTLTNSRALLFALLPLDSIAPTGIASTAAFGTAQLNQATSPSGIASTAVLGTPTLGQDINPTGIASTTAFGTPSLGHQLTPTGIASTAVFGTPEIFTTTPISPTGIPSTAAVGAPRLDQQITAAGIASTAQLGTPTISIPINPTGIGSTAQLGTPRLDQQVVLAAIGSTVVFGTSRLDQQITVGAGIASTLSVGTPSLVEDAEPPDNPLLTIPAHVAKATISQSHAKAVLT